MMSSLEKVITHRTEEILASELGLLRYLQTRDLGPLEAETVNQLLSQLMGKGCPLRPLTFQSLSKWVKSREGRARFHTLLVRPQPPKIRCYRDHVGIVVVIGCVHE